MIDQFIKSTTLMLVLLNPFLLIVYLLDLVEELSKAEFARVLIRAGMISLIVFALVAVVGEKLFVDIFQVKFASFQIFGGLIFLIVGLRFVFVGYEAFKELRGKPGHISGSIAMPIMIGPATVSASVITGQRLDTPHALLSIFIALFLSVISMIFMKNVYEYIQWRNEKLVHRYIEITGRVTALVAGMISVEMIMSGVAEWIGGL